MIQNRIFGFKPNPLAFKNTVWTVQYMHKGDNELETTFYTSIAPVQTLAHRYQRIQ